MFLNKMIYDLIPIYNPFAEWDYNEFLNCNVIPEWPHTRARIYDWCIS